jgi:hypothetical protein
MTDESTTHHTPFGIEVDRRESHLAALPGKLHFEWFESLKRATQVFNGNYLDLERHLTQFVGTMVHVDDLPDDFDVEANRLLHNYVAAMATLRDIQRRIHRQLWPDRFAPDDPKDKRTNGKSRCGNPRPRNSLEPTPSDSWPICGTSHCITRSRP